MIGQVTNVLDHGFVVLTDTMGDDRTPARTARTSFNNASKERSEEQDAKLTRYLVGHGHNTPLEFCQLRFYAKMPIFVARQWVRHRTASINEISLRYVDASDQMYIPAPDRMQKQSEDNKQGSSVEIVENERYCRAVFSKAYSEAYRSYQMLLEQGLAKELARSVLPLGTYTEWYWQTDLHNFLHFCKLRTDPHAQYEIRVYAEAMLTQAESVFPSVIAAWRAKEGI
jgi:thymidylate synthase (FAD)